MSSSNSERVIALLNKYVTNINRLLKKIKLDIMANFIQVNNRGLVIITNKIAAISNFNTIKQYIKNIDVVDSNEVISPRLLQSKSYLKILGIPYYIKDTNVPISSDIVEKFIQTTYIFNNIVLASYPYIIKAFPKSDMAIAIWNSQSNFKAKNLINRCSNIGSHITIIYNMNMNSSIL